MSTPIQISVGVHLSSFSSYPLRTFTTIFVGSSSSSWHVQGVQSCTMSILLDVQGYKSHLFPAAGFEGFSILNPHGTRVQGLPIYRVPQPRPFIVELFLDFCSVFSPELPINFLVIMIHQLIWPSAGPPVPSRDSLFETTRETVTDSCHIYTCKDKAHKMWLWDTIGELLFVSARFQKKSYLSPCPRRRHPYRSITGDFSISGITRKSCWPKNVVHFFQKSGPSFFWSARFAK